MATAIDKLKNKYGSTLSNSSRILLSKYGTKYEEPTTYDETQTYEDTDYNKTGFIGGLGYTVARFGTGAFGILEGIWDFAAGGLADIFGADEWAEKQFANNITGNWNQQLDEWYNPSTGWRLAGDIASGLGNSAVGVAAAALSGGTLAPVIAGLTMGVGAAGMATSEAYEKTGELGLKEYGYGALSGATEFALEWATGGAGRLAKLGASKLGMQTAKNLAKKSVLKEVASGFAGEFAEEAISELVTPYYQRWTQVDPNAENATIQQIGYAGLVGGLAGALMGGGGQAMDIQRSTKRGQQLHADKAHEEWVYDTAKKFQTYENENLTGQEGFQYFKDLVDEYESLGGTDYSKNTAKEIRRKANLLGQMERANVATFYSEDVERSKQKIIENKDEFVKYINAKGGFKDYQTGKTVQFKDGDALVNDKNALTQLAVADTLGQILTSPDNVYDLISQQKTDEVLQMDFSNFQKNADKYTKDAIKEMFGFEKDIDSLTYDEFIQKVKGTDATNLRDTKKRMAFKQVAKIAVRRAQNLGENVGKFKASSMKEDNIYVYKLDNGKSFSVVKEGADYYLFYDNKISFKMNLAKLEETVKALNGQEAQQTAQTAQTAQTQAPQAQQPVQQPTPQQPIVQQPVAQTPQTTQETGQIQTQTPVAQPTATDTQTAQESGKKEAEKEDAAKPRQEEKKEEKKSEKKEEKTKQKPKKEEKGSDSKKIVNDFLTAMAEIKKEKKVLYDTDVLKYVDAHPELNFIDRMFNDDKTAVDDLYAFLAKLDDIEKIEKFKTYLTSAYKLKAKRFERETGKSKMGQVTKFGNIVKKRLQELGTGTNLGIENGTVTLEEIESLFAKLNSSKDVADLAKKIFPVARRLGVNIRFTNSTFATQRSGESLGGDNVGDMVEYKTSYFNDTTISDQDKASTILHELIHACTMYVMRDYKGQTHFIASDDTKTTQQIRLANCATRLNQIYNQISQDEDFKDEYGITNAYEMVAELSDTKFIEKMKKKNLWQRVLDAICQLFGFNRGTSAYDNAMQCLDEILSNPDIASYKKYAMSQRRALLSGGKSTFGETQISQKVSETTIRDDIASGYDISKNLAYQDQHKEDIVKSFNAQEATMDLGALMGRYSKILKIWERLGGELNSEFLNDWNSKKGKDRAFTVFKEQAGYKYNIELSSMCKKGVPLFEAIDTIVKKEVMKELNLKTLGKAEKQILYDILKSHHFEIPCAICYVEQARQREGIIINSFLDGKIEQTKTGKITTYKLGWNQVLNRVQEEMRKNGVEYEFPVMDRSIATDKYYAKDYVMDEKTQDAFYKALQKIANEEISRYNKENGKSKPLIKEITPEAIKKSLGGNVGSNLKLFKVLFQNPNSRFTIDGDLLYSSMTTQNLAYWHNELYSLFNQQGGVSTFKTKQTPVVYWGDILKKKWTSVATQKEGGIRNQSNSDFQMYALLDYVQMYVDFTAKGYYLQAYTKVLPELKLLGLSDGKINASLIPRVIEYKLADGSGVDVERTKENAGLDENGNAIYDDVEGIPHKEAFMLIEDADYSKSITGVCIGYSDKHILKLLDDARVQLIIGFHDKTNDGSKRYRGARYAKNYNGINEAVDANGETIHIGFNQFIQKAENKFKYNANTGESATKLVYYKGKTYKLDEIPNLAADLYLEHCEENGYTPAYNDFKGHPNYYKLLADFGLKDSKGHYAPHKKVSFNMPDKVPYLDANGKKQYMSTEEYIKAELGKELAVRDAISGALADNSANGIIPQFKKAVEEMREGKVEISSKKVDKKNSRIYNKKTKYINDQLPTPTLSYIKKALNAIYDGVEDGIADSIAVEMGDNVFIVDSGMDSGKLDFGVRRKKTIHNKQLKEHFIRRTNNDAISKGYVSDGLFERIGDGSSSYIRRNLRRKSRQKLSTNNAKSQNNKGTVSQENANNGGLKASTNLGDVAYLNAVKRGDTERAQAMVDEYAKDAGYTIKAYHGSRNIFRAFDKSKLGSNTQTEASKRWFFAADQKTANSYYPYGVMQELAKKYTWAKPEDLKQKGKLYSLYLKMENPLTVDVKDYDYASHREQADAWVEFIEQAERNGNDGIILYNAMDNQLDTTARESTVYMFRDANQAKSAEPVTYDEDGSVIPLSKRFDRTKLDINFKKRKPIAGEDIVRTEMPDDSVSFGDAVTGKASWSEFAEQKRGKFQEMTAGAKVYLTNAQAELERVMKLLGIEDSVALTNYVRAGRNAAYNAIEMEGAQYSLDGETRLGASLGKIMQPIYNADTQTYEDFQLYLLHWHNTDRYPIGKPVFNKVAAEKQITDKDSLEAIKQLDEMYPDFKKIAEKLWAFSKNNVQLQVDSGVYSQEYADYLLTTYPHYVPTYREEYNMQKAGAYLGRNKVWVNNGIKAAKGSSHGILPIDDMLAAQTVQKYTSARVNKLLVDMLETGVETDDFKVIKSEETEIDIDTETEISFAEDKKKGNYEVSFYHNGKKVTAKVSKLVFSGLEAFQTTSADFDNLLVKALATANTTFKKLVTSLNPFFAYFRNPVRDMQDALLYSKYGTLEFSKAYKRAGQEISKNGKYWQEAKAAGIASASVYDYEKGIEYKKKKKWLGRKKDAFTQKMEKASNAIEMRPRLAEYICAREAGLSVQEALLQAQDITTNFGRGGTFAKKLNQTIMPFLNPAIQGFSKMWRAYTGEDGWKQWIILIVKSLILGVAATALNDILNDDDEEYEGLSDYIKEQNYVVALGDGDFLKIPKGRVLSVFGSAFLRGRRYAKGDEKAWEGYFDSVLSSVTPVDNITRTIFSPITDVSTNKAWHGGAIEGQKWDDTEPKNRYDESTSKISIWLGSVFNYSPIKIDYLLEQYTGVVGDLVLPATSTQAENGIVRQNLLANATTNSKWSNKFYSTIEDYTYKKTAGDIKAKGVVRYLNSISDEIRDMYNQKQTIQADKNLSDKEKLTQTKILQATINTLIQETLGNIDFVYNEMGKYDFSQYTDEKERDKAFQAAYLDTIKVVVGGEYAFKSYNSEAYEKATKIDKLGISYDSYYDLYFGLKSIEGEKDKDGNTINGSKKKAVIKYIWGQDISTIQKIILLMSQGYKINDGDIKNLTAKQASTAVAKYISKLVATKEEKTEIATMLGFVVKDGKIYSK